MFHETSNTDRVVEFVDTFSESSPHEIYSVWYFCADIHTDLLYSHTGYDVTSSFQSEVIAEKAVENAATDIFGWNFSRTVIIMKSYTLIGVSQSKHLPVLTWSSASGRLQTAIEYCV